MGMSPLFVDNGFMWSKISNKVLLQLIKGCGKAMVFMIVLRVLIVSCVYVILQVQSYLGVINLLKNVRFFMCFFFNGFHFLWVLFLFSLIKNVSLREQAIENQD